MPPTGSTRSAESAALIARVRHNLQRRCRVRRGERLLVAVSGGADSVALLDLVAAIAPRLGLHLEVAHFDHALRADSSEDARFVAELGRAYGFPVHSARWDSPRPGEAAARAARHVFLDEVASRTACTAIVLAHHLDDQIETALLRIERGSGLRGASGMAWRRAGKVPLVRPLLDVGRETLRAHLATAGLTWREDPTNADRSPARNRIRHEVLPVLQANLRAGWMERWGESMEELRYVSGWIDRLAHGLLKAAASMDDSILDRTALKRAPEVVRRRTLQLWIESLTRRAAPAGDRDGPAARAMASRRHLAAGSRIVRSGRSGQSLDLPGGWSLHVEPGRVRLASPEDAPHARRRDSRRSRRTAADSDVTNPSEYVVGVEAETAAADPAEARRIGARQLVRAPARVPSTSEVLLGAAALEPPFRCRRARPGDEVRLLGAPGTRKLYRVFQDREVPRTLRAIWPVVEDARGIIWVPGLGVAERARIRHPGEPAVRLRIGVADEKRPAGARSLVQDTTES